MEQNKFTKIKQSVANVPIWLLIVFVFVYMFGYWVGLKDSQLSQGKTPPPPTTAQQIIDNLPANAEIVYKLDEGVHSAEKSAHGSGTDITSDKSFWRGMSWLGLSANEAAAKDQGFTFDGKGGYTIGSMHGYGLLEQLWVWLRGMIWSVLFATMVAVLVLVAMLFNPVTAPIASGILRSIAALIPGIGSIVEAQIGRKRKAEVVDSLRETVAGGEQFKTDLRAEYGGGSGGTHSKIKEMFNTAHEKKQGTLTTKTAGLVRNIKNEI